MFNEILVVSFQRLERNAIDAFLAPDIPIETSCLTFNGVVFLNPL